MFLLADSTVFGPQNVFLFIFGIIFQCIDFTNQFQFPAFIENVKYLVILDLPTQMATIRVKLELFF